MSGFMRGRGTYQLTGKKMHYWHRSRVECSCRSDSDIIREHLEPAGFTVVGRFNELSGPGLADGSTDAMFEAVSGRQSHH